ncbi:TPA: hypothetical protein ACIQN7_002611 [Bacillus cereus]|uniref:hypothetical protein n=1 Tax=Bacillus cereus TaxID=1396 RepID=UPI0015CF576E|nr:hypothetical protein [Bacillus cereus]
MLIIGCNKNKGLNSMVKVCAYCNSSSGKLTGEHIYPNGIISKFPEYDHAFLEDKKGEPGEKKAIPLSPSNQVINDVCKKCNNDILGKLDDYGNDFILKYFSEDISKNEEKSIEYNHLILSKWVMKILYNGMRKEETSNWLRQNAKYIIGESSNATSEYSLFLGSYVQLSELKAIPFEAAANVPIFLESKSFGKDPDVYENENVEAIYYLRLMNAIFILVCWKENKWDSKEEEDLNEILPHSILRADQNSAVIVRATDFMNSSHPYLVSSKRAQSENDFRMKMMSGLGLF